MGHKDISPILYKPKRGFVVDWMNNMSHEYRIHPNYIHLLYYDRFVPVFRNSDYIFHSRVTAPYLHGPANWMTDTLFLSEMMIWCSEGILCTTSSFISQETHFANL